MRALNIISNRIRLIGLIAIVSFPAVAFAEGNDKNALAARVHDLFVARCAECHTPAPRGRGEDPTWLTDLAEVARDRSIVKLDKPEESRLYKFVKTGKMPKNEPEKGQKRAKLSDAETAMVLDWIKAGAPAAAAPALVASAAKFIPENHIIELIEKDLREQVAEIDRPLTRYLSLANLYNAMVNDPVVDTADDLELYRQAVSKVVNSLSWEERIVPPVAIDAEKTIFRIHLPDYGWSAELWQKLESFYPYGIDRQLFAAGNVQRLNGAKHPYLRADWFVFAVSQPPLYYDFLQIPGTDRELEKDRLHVNAEQNILQGRVLRAAMSKSGVSDQNRLVERHPIAGGYWKSYDFRSFSETGDPRVILRDYPLGPGNGRLDFHQAGGELIFALPNGLHGYMLVGAGGARIDTGPTDIVRDPGMKPASIIINGVSCMSCHTEGMKSLADDIGGKWLARQDVSPAEAGLLQKHYGRADKLAAGLKEDEERYTKALAEAGVTRKDLEPVRSLFERFRRPIKFAQAAAEVSLPVDDFADRLSRAHELKSLSDDFQAGGVPRDQFINFFNRIVSDLGLGRRVGFAALEVPAFGINAQLAAARKLVEQGAKYFEQVGVEKAIGEYTKIIESPAMPVDLVGQALVLRGQARPAQSDRDRALADFQRAIDLQGASDDIVLAALAARAQAYLNQGQHDLGLADLTRALELKDASADGVFGVLIARAGVYISDQQNEKAIADLSRAADLRGASVEQVADALRQRSDQYLNQKEPAKALADYDRIIALPGVSAEAVARAYFKRGTTLCDQDQEPRALVDFNRVIDMQDAPARLVRAALLRRAIIFNHQGHYDKAAADYTAVIDSKDVPADVQAAALAQRGMVQRHLNQNDKALADYTRAIEIKEIPAESLAGALVSRGVIFKGDNQLEKAIDDFSRVIDLPQVSELLSVALFNRAVCFGRLNQTDKALADYNRLIELKDVEVDLLGGALLERGIIYRERNQLDQAIADDTRVIELKNVSVDLLAGALIERGMVYEKQNHTNQAASDLKRAAGMKEASPEIKEKAQQEMTKLPK